MNPVPYDRLEEYVRRTYELHPVPNGRPGPEQGAPYTPEHHDSAETLAQLCGTSARTIVRYRKVNRIPFYRADRIATRLGTHPSIIFGDDAYYQPEADAEDRKEQEPA